MIASAMALEGGATSRLMVFSDDRSPEEREADRLRQEERERRYKAEGEREQRELTDKMMQESSPLLKLVGEKVTGVLRERVKDPEDDDYEWADAPLIVRITTESGLVLSLTGTSHDYDGCEASIKVEVISE